jgi:MoxR-like ATPase
MTDEEIDEKLEKQKAEAKKKKAEEEAKQKLYEEIEKGNDEVLKSLSKILPFKLLQRLKAFRDIQNSRLTEEQKSRVPSLKYIPSNGEFVKALSALLHPVWSAPLLTGPKGTGKSTLAESLAAALNLPVVKIYGGIDVNAEGLLGGKTLVPVENRIDAVTEMRLRTAAKQAGVNIEPILQRLKEVQLRVSFEPGLLLNAVLNGEMVIMEEVNMLQPDVTSLLHGLLDWSRQLSVPGYKTITAPENFRLVGTINPDYAGTKELNEAFEDRFRMIEVPYPERNVLLQVLLQETGIEKELAEVMVDIFERIRGRVENGDLDTRSLSFRRLLRAAEDIKLEIDEPFKCIQSNLAEGLNEVEKNIIIEIVRDYQRSI